MAVGGKEATKGLTQGARPKNEKIHNNNFVLKKNRHGWAKFSKRIPGTFVLNFSLSPRPRPGDISKAFPELS
jgi:hypothetical protein